MKVKYLSAFEEIRTEEERIINEGTIEELTEFAESYDIHKSIENAVPNYVDYVTRIKARLVDADIDPDTIRNVYWDNLRATR